MSDHMPGFFVALVQAIKSRHTVDLVLPKYERFYNHPNP